MPIFYTDSASFNSLVVTGSTILSGSSNTLRVYGSGSTIFSIYGSSGELFSIADSGSTTSLFSVSSGTTNILNIDNSKQVSISGSLVITGSLLATASWATNAISSSLAVQNLVTASVSLNTITFTKGDGTTFPIIVNTGSGGGGGGSVTINNNVDTYLVTATGIANTLDGEANLTFNGITLTNTGKSQFGGGSVLNTTHQFRATGSDTYAGFLISDPDGEDAFRMVGSMANSDLLILIGDVNDAYGTTKIEVDDPNSKINLKGKVYGNAYATNATTLGTNGTYDIGSRLATSWAVAGGPALIAGRIVYLSGSTQWAQAQANVSGSSYGMLGVVTDAESQNEILIQGTIQISGSALTSGIAGQPVYLSALTAGQVTLTAPSSSGHVVRTLGYIYKANSNIMYFNPDNSYIVRT